MNDVKRTGRRRFLGILGVGAVGATTGALGLERLLRPESVAAGEAAAQTAATSQGPPATVAPTTAAAPSTTTTTAPPPFPAYELVAGEVQPEAKLAATSS